MQDLPGAQRVGGRPVPLAGAAFNCGSFISGAGLSVRTPASTWNVHVDDVGRVGICCVEQASFGCCRGREKTRKALTSALRSSTFPNASHAPCKSTLAMSAWWLFADLNACVRGADSMSAVL
jgi:hypothetical protein